MIANHCLLYELQTDFTWTSECYTEKLLLTYVRHKNDDRYYKHAWIQSPLKVALQWKYRPVIQWK